MTSDDPTGLADDIAYCAALDGEIRDAFERNDEVQRIIDRLLDATDPGRR